MNKGINGKIKKIFTKVRNDYNILAYRNESKLLLRGMEPVVCASRT